MVSNLNRAQINILLKHLDELPPFSNVEPTSLRKENQSLDFFTLTNFYESLDAAHKLTVLVEIVETLRSCDSEDLVEIIDNRLDELNNCKDAVRSDCDEDNEDHENGSDDDEIVFVNPTVSISEENDDNDDNDGDHENSSSSALSGGINGSESGPQFQFPAHFLQTSFNVSDPGSNGSTGAGDDEDKWCELCDKFVKKKGWYKHMNTVHSTQRFSCTLCPNSKFKAKKYWKAHMRNIHKDLNIQFPDGRSAGASTFGLLGPGLRCGQCFMAFTSVEQLKHHSDTVHKVKDEEADESIEASDAEEEQEQEEMSNTTSPPEDSAAAGATTCRLCNKTFQSPHHLALHDQAVHNEEMAQCPYCLIMTKSLRNHIKFVHMKKFQCELCHKSFSANAKLTRHLESHLRGTNRVHNPLPNPAEAIISSTGAVVVPKDRPKNITCDLCGYKCVSTWKLNRHMNAHRKGTNRFSLH